MQLYRSWPPELEKNALPPDVRDRETPHRPELEFPQAADIATVDEGAVLASRRHTARTWRLGLVVAFITVAAVGAAKLITGYERAVPVFGGGMITETIELSCITSEQASDLASPLLRSGQPGVYAARGMSAIAIRGAPREVAAAKAAINQFDTKCQLPKGSNPTR